MRHTYPQLILTSTLSLLISFPCFLTLAAQNLVPNPDFEYYDNCPGGYNQGYGPMTCFPWICPTNGSADYFNACHVGVVGVPDNAFGTRSAHSGVGYVGFLCFYEGITNYREYISVQLEAPLIADSTYTISFWYSVGELTCPIDQVGLLLTQDVIDSPTDYHALDSVPQIEATIESDTTWHLFSDTYLATGGEEWITIGNFHPDAVIVLGQNCPLWDNMTISYIYLDDVSVIPGIVSSIDANQVAEVEPVVYPNPNTGQFFVKLNSPEDAYQLEVYDLLGRKVLQQELSGDSSPNEIRLQDRTSGIYTILVRKADFRYVVKMAVVGE